MKSIHNRKKPKMKPNLKIHNFLKNYNHSINLKYIKENLYTKDWEIIPRYLYLPMEPYNPQDPTDPTKIIPGIPQPKLDEDHDEPDYDENNLDGIFEGVQIIPVFGVLGGHITMEDSKHGAMDYYNIQYKTRDAMDNPNVKQVLFYFHSPGGDAMGCKETSDLIGKLSQVKTTVAYTNTMMASAAYRLASQCNYIYSSETAMVGCVGAMLQHIDISEKLKAEGVKITTYTSGEFKDMGSPMRPATPIEEKMMQEGTQKSGNEFAKYILAKRPNIKVEYLSKGQIFDGIEAAEYNLTDGVINYIDDVFDMMITPQTTL